jgi:uncharacterized protein (TIGR02145 family)
MKKQLNFVLLLLLVMAFVGCKKETTTPEPTPPVPITLTDIDGNVYPTVKIGTQVWMAENLRVTRTPAGALLNTFAPNSDNANITEYGRLYLWDDALAAVPAGWRLPSKADWDLLIAQLGGNASAGAKLKHTQFSTQPANGNGGTNESGFGVKGAGYRVPPGNIFAFRAYTGFWTSTDISATSKVVNTLGVDRINVAEEFYSPLLGFSVRYIKNN